MALVGKKVDLEANRKVGTHEALEYTERNNIFFVETSAKTLQNIGEFLYELGKRWLRDVWFHYHVVKVSKVLW